MRLTRTDAGFLLEEGSAVVHYAQASGIVRVMYGGEVARWLSPSRDPVRVACQFVRWRSGYSGKKQDKG